MPGIGPLEVFFADRFAADCILLDGRGGNFVRCAVQLMASEYAVKLPLRRSSAAG